jgi:hypothetical protein
MWNNISTLLPEKHLQKFTCKILEEEKAKNPKICG